MVLFISPLLYYILMLVGPAQQKNCTDNPKNTRSKKAKPQTPKQTGGCIDHVKKI